jgi:Uma2 family endonuclease
LDSELHQRYFNHIDINAPDLIIETLSKGNTAEEMKIKYELRQIYVTDAVLNSDLFPELRVSLEEIFVNEME